MNLTSCPTVYEILRRVLLARNIVDPTTYWYTTISSPLRRLLSVDLSTMPVGIGSTIGFDLSIPRRSKSFAV